MQLVIAEKPSVAQSIAAALGVKEKKDGYIEGGGYLISWCVGHLVQLAEAAAYGEQYRKWSYDSLPILPQNWQYTVAADKGKQFKILKELMHRADVSEVVNACDAGREGELIFRFVYEVAGCKKPMRRLWISSMEDAAIRSGFDNLKDGRDYDALFASALCRAKAECISVTREKKTVSPPKLFDLTSLQREANRIYGYTAKQTLDLAQALYEKRLLTYPRTDSAFLTDDMGGTATNIAALLCGKLPFMQDVSFTPDVSRTLDSKKVSDHYAIIPTLELAKTDLAALPESERNILTLAGARLLFAAAEPHSYEAVMAVFSCADNSFTTKGKSVLCAGWKDLERRYRLTLKGKPDTDDGDSDFVSDVPDFTEGQTFSDFSTKVTVHDTHPPKPHTEASLLSAMEHAGSEDTNADAERKGLGTPATRAAVIEKLVNSGFVERKGKQLFPTKNGINLVCVLPDNLTSPKLTAEWENTLTLIAKGNANPEDFMQGIEAMAQELVKAYPFLSEKDKELFKEEKPVIGKCPRCGSPVHESKRNYYCSDRDCTFTMWKNDRFFEERKTAFTPKIAAALLNSGKVSVKGLYSPKTGKTYDGNVVLADTGGKYVNYRVELPKKK